MGSQINEWVDTDRYPIDDPSSDGYRDVVERARGELARLGAAELPGFVSEGAISKLVADAHGLMERGHASSGVGTPYLELPDEDRFGPEHARRTWMPYSLSAVAYDIIPIESMLRKIYESEAVRALVEAIVDRGSVMRYADPFGALNLAVMGDGDELQWHFDQTDFVVSLAIATADAGGDFEVAPKIRTADDEAYDDVASVLAGDASRVLTLEMTPGTLLVFEGRNSLHRVSKIHGSRPRLVGLLGYDTSPGAMGSELLRSVRYGRTVPFETPPVEWSRS